MDCGQPGDDDAATDAAAGDADWAGCNDTGEPTGTRTTLLTLSDGGSESFADFDIDCSGIVVATTEGRILTCPPTGCTGAPLTISGSIPPLPPSPGNTSNPYYPNAYRVRIGLRGVVLAESTVNGNSESDVYTLHRDGTGVVLLHQLEGGSDDASRCQTNIVLQDLSVANGDAFSVQGCFGGAGMTFLTAILPRGGTCVPATNVETLFTVAGDSFPPYPVAAAPLVGADYYGVIAYLGGGPFWVVYANALTQGVNPWAYLAPAFGEGFQAIAASTTFVAVSSHPSGDGGADKGGVAVCPPESNCPQPVWVSGIPSVATRLYADATTLYFTDASNNLYACDAATALAGSCTPQTLASPAPSFAELRSDASNVYLLTPTSVIRIAK